jgi:protein-S-isoprenylcysteine O-methyltransferase Ste14
MFGWCIGSGLVVCYALTVIAIVTGAIMIRAEDKELEERFGAAFREYKSAVPAVFPRSLPV